MNAFFLLSSGVPAIRKHFLCGMDHVCSQQPITQSSILNRSSNEDGSELVACLCQSHMLSQLCSWVVSAHAQVRMGAHTRFEPRFHVASFHRARGGHWGMFRGVPGCAAFSALKGRGKVKWSRLGSSKVEVGWRWREGKVECTFSQCI